MDDKNFKQTHSLCGRMSCASCLVPVTIFIFGKEIVMNDDSLLMHSMLVTFSVAMPF